MPELNKDDLNFDEVSNIVKKHVHKGKRTLIAMLQDVQEEYGYLPEEAMCIVSQEARIPLSKIYGVATFYSQFRLKPLGKYVISVCDGTACHVRGSMDVIQEAQSILGIKPDETTDDTMFSLRAVACIGACALAPAMVVNDQTYPKMTPKELGKIIKDCKSQG